jgi:hypothetical protein
MQENKEEPDGEIVVPLVSTRIDLSPFEFDHLIINFPFTMQND